MRGAGGALYGLRVHQKPLHKRERICRPTQASKRSADATQNGKKKRAGSPDPAKPTQQADVGQYSRNINVQPSGEAETKEKKPSQHSPKRQNIILLLPTSKGANLPKPREWQRAKKAKERRKQTKKSISKRGQKGKKAEGEKDASQKYALQRVEVSMETLGVGFFGDDPPHLLSKSN